MIGRTERFLQMLGAVPADFEQSIGELDGEFVFALHSFQPFADRFGDRFGEALSGESGQALGELVGVFILNVQAHMVDILPCASPILP